MSEAPKKIEDLTAGDFETCDRITAGQHDAPVRKGSSGPVPFGYLRVEGVFVVRVVDAETVRQAFSLFLNTKKITVVQEFLEKRTARKWVRATVRNLLKNPAYAGIVRGKKQHAPIIDQMILNRALGIFKRKKKK